MVTGYNKPKELPTFLQVKLMPILKLRVLIKDQHFKIQNLKLIQDNLKKFWYWLSYSIPKSVSSYFDTDREWLSTLDMKEKWVSGYLTLA